MIQTTSSTRFDYVGSHLDWSTTETVLVPNLHSDLSKLTQSSETSGLTITHFDCLICWLFMTFECSEIILSSRGWVMKTAIDEADPPNQKG